MLTPQEKQELIALTELLETRKKFYSINATKLQKHQQILGDAIAERINIKQVNGIIAKMPKNKYILYQGGNGSGKTLTGMYHTVLLALGDTGIKYGLPFIGSRIDIRIVTKSGSNVTSTIQPYLLGEYSKTRIPPDEIEKINLDNGVLKSITLKNGCKISIRTYDQGYERLMGGNPDFILIDEEPTSKLVWEEILARGRKPYTQIVLTMTPLHGLTPVYSYFYQQENEDVKKRCKTLLVSSLDNIHADHTGLLGLSEQDRKMRIHGMFVPPSGLVYSSFIRKNNTVAWFNPKDLGDNVSFYGAIDFGHTHPTAFLCIAVDEDGNLYVFDMLYKKGLLMKEIAEGIKALKRKYGIDFEYIVADTAAKQQREELKALGLKTVPADKWSIGENNESNRKAGIFKVNQLLADGKLYIADTCKDLITEFEQHHYKDKGTDGEVEKTQDDALRCTSLFHLLIQTTKNGNIAEKRIQKYILSFSQQVQLLGTIIQQSLLRKSYKIGHLDFIYHSNPLWSNSFRNLGIG